MRSFVAAILVALVSLLLLVPVSAAPGKAGATVVPWSLYQRALRWQVMAPRGDVPEEKLLIFCTVAPPRQQLEQMISAGYTLEAVAGRTILVSAPITLYIDQEQGLDALGFVSLASMQIENSTNPQQAMDTGDWVDMFEPAVDAPSNASKSDIYGYHFTE